jgi:hypothetical protein
MVLILVTRFSEKLFEQCRVILNEIGVDHVVFSYHFLPQGGDMEEIINISKELALYAK